MINTSTQFNQLLVKEIPFFDGSSSFKQTWPILQERLNQIIDEGKYTNGRMVRALERAIENYTGARFAIGVGNGTDALILLLRAAGIKPGDEVIVPCFTFFASASSIALVGARPVFVDIDPVTYSLDPDAVRAAITNKTRAIMPVHLFTQMADMTALRQISNQTGIPLIEDSAEAIGMWFDGLHAGLFGAGGVLSFFPTKTLGALGDAGMILTQDQAIAEKCRIMRDHGRTTVVVDKVLIASDEASISGTNSKMDEIQAAILLTRLERIDQDIARRAHLARLYDDRLAHLAPRVTTPKIARREVVANPVYYVYLIEADRKDELAAYLKANGIGTEAYYPIPLHLQPCFKYLGYRQGDFPNAERACKRTLGLPFYPDLSDSDIQYVCETIGKFYAQEGQS